MFLYVFIIVTGVITLILADNEIAEVTIKRLLLANYCIAIVAFIALIPFIKAMFNLLKPSTILEELSKDIKEEKILDYLDDKEENEDPIQPMVDIIHSSCIRNDYNSFKKGLNLINDSIALILNENNQEKILNHVLDHYNAIGMVALNNNDENYINYVLIALLSVGKHSVDEKLENKTMTIFGNIGKITASKFENATMYAASYLKDIHIMAMKSDKSISLRHMANLGCIGQIALEQKFDIVVEIIIDFIKEIIDESFEQDNQIIINGSLLSLRKIGKTALEQELDLVIEPIINVIKDLGKKSIKNYEMSAKMALLILEDICMITLNERLESKVISAIKSFEYIGEEAINQKNEIIIEEVLVSFYRIGNVSLEHNIESSILATLESLETIENELIQQGMNKLALKAVHIIQKFEKKAEKNHIENVFQRIEKSYVNILKTAKKEKVKEIVDILKKRDNSQNICQKYLYHGYWFSS